MEYDDIFFKKKTFHFTELHSCKNGKNEDQPLNASSRAAVVRPKFKVNVLHFTSFLYINGKWYYAGVILKEIGIFGYGDKTYCKSDELRSPKVVMS